MKKEKWVKVEGTDGEYEVSNFGKLRCVFRHRKGFRFPLKKPKILKGSNARGYIVSNIHYHGKTRPVCLHRIIAIAFIPNPENKPFINHKNGIKNDNRIENLEWCTQKENIHHAIRNNLIPRPCGENAGGSKLTQEQVIDILNSNEKIKVLAIKYGVSYGAIHEIKAKQTWKHINL